MKIAPGIYQLKSPIDNFLASINCYLIQGKDGWLMLDTGFSTSRTFDLLQKQLKEIGIALTDISRVIATHSHPDHFGLAGKIKQVSPGMELYIHRMESDLIESRYVRFPELREQMSAMLSRHGVPGLDLPDLGSASLPALEFVTLTFPDHILYGGEIIGTGIYDLEVIWTPGHSPGHICLYEPENRLLFSGDHILPGITPNVGAHVQSGDNPLVDYICSLLKLRHLPVSWVLPAHEEMFTDLGGRIDQIIEHHKRRKEEIEKTISGGAQNSWEISSRVQWNVKDGWDRMQPLTKRAAVMETIAHLESLRSEGRVQRTITDGKISYSLK